MDLRIQKTYLALHNAFTALLEEKRFEEFTINELCQRAMIRRTTFYKHFADKYEYFSFYVQEVAAEFLALLPPETTFPSAGSYLLQMANELIRFVREHEKLVMNIYNSSIFPVLLNSLAEQVTRDVHDTLVRIHGDDPENNTRLEVISLFYSGGLLHTFLRMWGKNRALAEERFLDIISDAMTFNY